MSKKNCDECKVKRLCGNTTKSKFVCKNWNKFTPGKDVIKCTVCKSTGRNEKGCDCLFCGGRGLVKKIT